MTVTVYLVRHAAHDWLGKVLCGRTLDVRISAAGVEQARHLGDRLVREKITAVFSSPLGRARQTAELIGRALHLEVRTDDALNEVDLGAWSGCRFEDLADDPAWQLWNRQRDIARPPGGESMQDVQARLRAWIASLLQPYAGCSVAGVTHADVIKAALADCLGLSLSRHDHFEIAPASVSVLLAGAWGSKVRSINEAPTCAAA